MKTTKIIAPLFALALLGAACGGSDAAPTEQQPVSEGSNSTSDSSMNDSSTSEETSATEVTIQDFAFAPKKASVSVGDTVTWINTDDILHTVTSGIGQKQGVPGVTKDKDAKPDGLFDEEVEFEETFEFTFDKAGSYRYFCSIHPGMVGTVVVK